MVLHYLNGTESLKVVAAQYGFGHTTLRRFIDWYENDQERLLTLGVMEGDNINAANTSADGGNFSDTVASEVALKAIQEELHLAKVKLACLETLIDFTERDLGIDIRKKAGTRSSAE